MRCQQYYKDHAPVGRSKEQNLRRLINDKRIADIHITELEEYHITGYARIQIDEDGVQPATFQQDYFDIKFALDMTKPMFGVPVTSRAVTAAPTENSDIPTIMSDTPMFYSQDELGWFNSINW